MGRRTIFLDALHEIIWKTYYYNKIAYPGGYWTVIDGREYRPGCQPNGACPCRTPDANRSIVVQRPDCTGQTLSMRSTPGPYKCFGYW